MYKDGTRRLNREKRKGTRNNPFDPWTADALVGQHGSTAAKPMAGKTADQEGNAPP
jgi:hypothetical protein